MLQVSNIRKLFKSNEILKGVSLNVAEKEIVAVTGSSGAGKTTLLQIIGTLDKADSGSMLLAGQNYTDLRGERLSKFRNTQLGFIFQFHNLLGEFTAMENVALPGWINGVNDKREVLDRAEGLLVKLGLGHRLNARPSELSGGEQQRVAAARALINSPRLILADEPSGNLDSRNAQELHELFFQMRDEFGQTFLIVTHNDKLASMADRQIIMKDGLMADFNS